MEYASHSPILSQWHIDCILKCGYVWITACISKTLFWSQIFVDWATNGRWGTKENRQILQKAWMKDEGERTVVQTFRICGE